MDAHRNTRGAETSRGKAPWLTAPAPEATTHTRTEKQIPCPLGQGHVLCCTRKDAEPAAAAKTNHELCGKGIPPHIPEKNKNKNIKWQQTHESCPSYRKHKAALKHGRLDAWLFLCCTPRTTGPSTQVLGLNAVLARLQCWRSEKPPSKWQRPAAATTSTGPANPASSQNPPPFTKREILHHAPGPRAFPSPSQPTPSHVLL